MNGEAVLLGTVVIVAGTAGLVMLGHVMVEQIKQRSDIGKIRDDLQIVADSTATVEHDVAIETDEDEGDVADYLLHQNMPPEEIKLDLNVVMVQTNDPATLKNLVSFIPGWKVSEDTTYKPPKRKEK